MNAVPTSAAQNLFLLPPNQRKLVLVVDDFDDSAKMLAEQVEYACGHEAVFAKDGIEALEIAQVRRPDFVVLDIDMPRLNGIETAREFRKRYADHCPCLVAFSGGHSVDSANTELFDRVLVKPNDTEVLMKLVCHLDLESTEPSKDEP